MAYTTLRPIECELNLPAPDITGYIRRKVGDAAEEEIEQAAREYMNWLLYGGELPG